MSGSKMNKREMPQDVQEVYWSIIAISDNLKKWNVKQKFRMFTSYINSLKDNKETVVTRVIEELIAEDNLRGLYAAGHIIKQKKLYRFVRLLEEKLYSSEKNSVKQYELMKTLLELKDKSILPYVLEFLDSADYLSETYARILSYIPLFSKKEYYRRAQEYMKKVAESNLHDYDKHKIISQFIIHIPDENLGTFIRLHKKLEAVIGKEKMSNIFKGFETEENTEFREYVRSKMFEINPEHKKPKQRTKKTAGLRLIIGLKNNSGWKGKIWGFSDMHGRHRPRKK